jgi:hypothetical protein
MADFDLAAEQARVAQLRGQADEVLTGLRDKLAAVREASQSALSVTGEATSRDGTVRVVVDATGVVTDLVFAPTAFDQGSPERLARATIATIQAAAARARATVSDSLATVRAPGSGILAAAAAAYPELRADGLRTPAVPRTATDPEDDAGSWSEPAAAAGPRADPDDDVGASMFDNQEW